LRHLLLWQSGVKFAVDQLDSLKEVDTKIDFKNSYKKYVLSVADFSVEMKNYFEVLKVSRDSRIESPARERLYHKALIMNEQIGAYKAVERKLDAKYEL